MRKGLTLLVVGILGCSPSGPRASDEAPVASPSQAEPDPEPEQPEPNPEPNPEQPEPEPNGITVLMTAATLADDCGGGPNLRSEPKPTSDFRGRASKMKGKRQCKQSSIQLAVTSPEGSPSAKITVKSVELVLTDGTSLGMLETRTPSVWSDGDGYTPWNETVEPGQDLSVSYAITQPDWSQVEDRRSQSYTVKAVVSIAGADQTLEQNVVVDTPTSLPPGVKT